MKRPENSADNKPAHGPASQDDPLVQKGSDLHDSDSPDSPVDSSAEANPDETPDQRSPEDLQARTLKTLNEQIEDLKRQNLRLLADYENLKKRAAKEFLQASTVGAEHVVKKLLPVLDSFESALRHLTDGKAEKKFIDGVELLFMQISDALEREGLKAIPAKGNKFDPNLHEALMKGHSDEFDDEIIMSELEKGYTFKERVIRPAKVQINQKQ